MMPHDQNALEARYWKMLHYASFLFHFWRALQSATCGYNGSDRIRHVSLCDGLESPTTASPVPLAFLERVWGYSRGTGLFERERL